MDCLFCNSETMTLTGSNDLVYCIRDKYPVTLHHTLVIPYRHAETYFDLTQEEVAACNALLFSQKEELQKIDSTITGFNIGMNAGADAGQTVMHCHIHLVPRRKGDMADPAGGVRGVIPEKQKYGEKL